MGGVGSGFESNVGRRQIVPVAPNPARPAMMAG